MLLNYETTLNQILASRDNRAAKQKMLIEKYNLPVITFTVNMPGTYKNTPFSKRFFIEGYNEIVKILVLNGIYPSYKEDNDQITGFEAYIVARADAHMIKDYTIKIENQHPLGRMFDFDVLDCEGNVVSRDSLGYPRRRCLLCKQEAYICVRSKKHSISDLLDKIQSISNFYFKD
jgi:holo-ACP synthase